MTIPPLTGFLNGDTRPIGLPSIPLFTSSSIVVPPITQPSNGQIGLGGDANPILPQVLITPPVSATLLPQNLTPSQLQSIILVSKPSVNRAYVANSLTQLSSDVVTFTNIAPVNIVNVQILSTGGVSFTPNIFTLNTATPSQDVEIDFDMSQVNLLQPGETVITCLINLTSPTVFIPPTGSLFVPVTYTVTISSNPNSAGTVTLLGGGNAPSTTLNNVITVPTDTNGDNIISVSANPVTGYQFVNWTLNGVVVSTDSTTSITTIQQSAIVANYTQIQYSINLGTNSLDGLGNGSVAGPSQALAGSTVIVNTKPTPIAGYDQLVSVFVNWTENDTIVSTDSTYIFTITGNRNLIANFNSTSIGNGPLITPTIITNPIIPPITPIISPVDMNNSNNTNTTDGTNVSINSRGDIVTGQ